MGLGRLIPNMNKAEPKWKKRFNLEREAQKPFLSLDENTLRALIRGRQITSNNYDTVLSLDFPHYCSGATNGCGGDKGWCYTFHGFQSLSQHNSKVALIDIAARRIPIEFADKVVEEVLSSVEAGEMVYPNLRYSGSGEVALEHIPALALIISKGVKLWGFSRNISVAVRLREIGASVLVSCDKTTPQKSLQNALNFGFKLSYTSTSVVDHPPQRTFVVFPLHRSGTVREVVDNPAICPKVLEEFLHGDRTPSACQKRCNRCHDSNHIN